MRNENHKELMGIFYTASSKMNNLSLKKKDDYKIAVSNAYADAFRRAKGSNKNVAMPVLDWLSEKLFNYFNDGKTIKNQQEYDKWFMNTSTDFLNNLNGYKGFQNFEFGKAQKVVNMSMKYLYCFYDYLPYEKQNKFKFCHMAIDDYILNWLIENWLKSVKNVSSTKIREISWSHLQLGCNKSDVYSYLWLQDNIKQYLYSNNNSEYRDSKNNALSPFIAEFYIWSEVHFINALKELNNQEIFKKYFPSYKSIKLRNLINNTLKNLNNLNF